MSVDTSRSFMFFAVDRMPFLPARQIVTIIWGKCASRFQVHCFGGSVLPYFKNCSRPAAATETALTIVALVAAALIRTFSATRRPSLWLLLLLLCSGDSSQRVVPRCGSCCCCSAQEIFRDASSVVVALVAAALLRRFSATRRALIWLLLWLFVAVVASLRMERFLDASGFLVAPVVAGNHHVPLSWDFSL